MLAIQPCRAWRPLFPEWHDCFAESLHYFGISRDLIPAQQLLDLATGTRPPSRRARRRSGTSRTS